MGHLQIMDCYSRYSPTTTSRCHALSCVYMRGYTDKAAMGRTMWLRVPCSRPTLSRMASMRGYSMPSTAQWYKHHAHGKFLSSEQFCSIELHTYTHVFTDEYSS